MSKIALRVTDKGFVPADRHSAEQMRSRGYSPGDVVFAEIRKPRHPGFHRLAHAFGQLLVDNLNDFAGMDSHKALKRLQLESGIACDSANTTSPTVYPLLRICSAEWRSAGMNPDSVTRMASLLNAASPVSLQGARRLAACQSGRLQL